MNDETILVDSKTPEGKAIDNSHIEAYRKVSDITPEPPKTRDPYCGFSMKWYFFLTRFALWAVAASYVSVISVGFSEIKEMSKDKYALYYNGKSSDILRQIYACYKWELILSIIVTILTIFAAIKLIKLKKDGPTLLYAVYVCNILISFFVAILINSINDIPEELKISNLSLLVRIAVPAILLVVNMNYFRKRSVVFVK